MGKNQQHVARGKERASEREKNRTRKKTQEQEASMGIGAGLLKLTSALSAIVSIILVGASGYVYSKQDPHIGQIALARITVQGALGLGVVILILSVVGYWGASSKNRCLMYIFFALLQAAFAGPRRHHRRSLHRLALDRPA